MGRAARGKQGSQKEPTEVLKDGDKRGKRDRGGKGVLGSGGGNGPGADKRGTTARGVSRGDDQVVRFRRTRKRDSQGLSLAADEARETWETRGWGDED